MSNFLINYSKHATLLLILFISIAVYKQLMFIHGSHFELLAKVTFGVIEGKPAWIAFQNRLLGPMLVLLISKLGFTFAYSLKLFYFFTITAESYLLYFLLLKSGKSSISALGWVVAYSFLFIIFQDRHWFYTWDSFDILFFTLFSYLALKVHSISSFIILFLFALLNRESALFIALFIFIGSFNFATIKPKLLWYSSRNLAIGCILLISGAIYTKFIRSYLFISQPDGSEDTMHQALGNHIHFKDNLILLFVNNLASTDLINSFFVLGSVFCLSLMYKFSNANQRNLIIIYVAIVISIIVFGLINETRMYFILFPVLIFLIANFNVPRVINTNSTPK